MSTKAVSTRAGNAKQPARSETPENHAEKPESVHAVHKDEARDDRPVKHEAEDKVSLAAVVDAHVEGEEATATEANGQAPVVSETSMAAEFSFGGALADAAASAGSLITEAEGADDVDYGDVGDGSGGTVLLIGAIALIGLGIAVAAGGGKSNEPPTVNATQTVTTPEDTNVNITVAGNDPDGDPLTYTASGVNASHGTVTGGANGVFVFDPADNFNGTTTFTVTVADPDGETATQTVTVNVTAVNDAPTGTTPVSVSTNEDTALSGPSGITDVDNATLTFDIVTPATNGILVVSANGNYTYTPNADFNGTDSFSIKGTDSAGLSFTKVFNVTVNAVNDAPEFPEDSADVVTPEDTPLAGTIASATDVDGDALTYSLGTQAANGTATVDANGDVVYTPNANYTGPDSFTVVVSDGNGGTDTATINVTVTPVNDAPEFPAASTAVSTDEDTPLAGMLPAATEVEGDALSYGLGTGATSGTAVVNADGSYTYTPNANFNGSDGFTATVSDGNGGTDTITVNVTVNPVNDAPTFPTDAVSDETDSETAITGSIGNATDIDGDALTYSLGSAATNGTATVDANGSYNYTPNSGFIGSDSFTAVVDDGNGGTDTITVNITVTEVNVAPEFPSDSANATTAEDTALNGTLPTATDGNAGDTLTYSLNVNGDHGDVIVNANGSYTYTPDQDYNGPDSFIAQVSDGKGGLDSITINVTVTPVNDAPTFPAESTSASTAKDVQLNGSLPAATDIENDPLTYSLSSNASNGNVVVNANGTYTYGPTVGFAGNDSFVAQVSDGNGGTDLITVNITVTGTPTLTVPIDVPASGPAVNFDATGGAFIYTDDFNVRTDVVLNGIDTDDVIKISNYPGGIGSLGFTNDGTNIIVTFSDGGAHFTQIVLAGADNNADGGLNFVTDYASAMASAGWDFLMVLGANAAPVFPVDSANASTAQNTVLNGTLPVATDSDGDPLTYSLGTAATNGSAVVNANGTYSYTPGAGFTGSDSFVAQVSDGNGGTDTVTINVNVTGGGGGGTTESIDVPASGPAVAFNAAGGSFVYTDDFNVRTDVVLNGIDTDDVIKISNYPGGIGSLGFTNNGTDIIVTFSDGGAHFTQIVLAGADNNADGGLNFVTDYASAMASAGWDFLMIAGANAAPVFPVTSANASTAQNTVLNGSLPVATDSDGDPLTYSLGTAAANGTAVVNANGSYSYTPGAGFTGNDSFVGQVSDGNGGTDTVTINVNVTGGGGGGTVQPIDVPASGDAVHFDASAGAFTYTDDFNTRTDVVLNGIDTDDVIKISNYPGGIGALGFTNDGTNIIVTFSDGGAHFTQIILAGADNNADGGLDFVTDYPSAMASAGWDFLMIA